MLARLMPTMQMPGLVRRYGGEIVAALLIVNGLALFAALATYHADDPSLNHLSDAAPKNALGYFGASLADMLKQTFGWMSVLLIFASFGFAWRLALKDDRLHALLRVLALVVAIMSGATMLYLMATLTHAGFMNQAGGAVGVIVAYVLVPQMTLWGTAALMALLFLATLPVALGLKFAEWVAIGYVLRVVGGHLAQAARSVAELFRSRHREEDLDDEDMLDEEDKEDEDEEEITHGPRLESKPKNASKRRR